MNEYMIFARILEDENSQRHLGVPENIAEKTRCLIDYQDGKITMSFNGLRPEHCPAVIHCLGALDNYSTTFSSDTVVFAFWSTSDILLETISELITVTKCDVTHTAKAEKIIIAAKEELFFAENESKTVGLSDEEAREAFQSLSKIMAPEDFNEFTEKIFEPKPLKEVSVPSIYAIPPEVEANYLSKGIRLIPTRPGH